MNKRIQKKRAKAELWRDKTKVIANLVVLMEPGLTRTEYLRMAKPLWKLDMNTLFEMSFHVMSLQFKRAFPLRNLLPRTSFSGEVANWKQITSMYERQ